MAFMRKAYSSMGSKPLEWYEKKYKKAFLRNEDLSADEGKQDEEKPVRPVPGIILPVVHLKQPTLSLGTSARILFGNRYAFQRSSFLRGHRTNADPLSADGRRV
jgi:hypothetical protein